MIDTNVGWGCRVSEPSRETGSTYCRSDQTVDKNCPGSTSGGGSGTKMGDGGTSCVYDANGWCDVACRSCSWG